MWNKNFLLAHIYSNSMNVISYLYTFWMKKSYTVHIFTAIIAVSHIGGHHIENDIFNSVNLKSES